jgi:hypothetical protein
MVGASRGSGGFNQRKNVSSTTVRESVNVARLLPITASAWEEEPTLEDAGDNCDSSECYVEIEGAENDSAECLVEIDDQHDAANIHRSW